MASKNVELAKECKRQYENCLYTAASFTIWLRWLRGLKVAFIIAPIVLGAFGSWKILEGSTDETMKAVSAISAFLAGLLSTIYSALKLDTHISDAKAAAGELTNLRDSFRQAALVSSRKAFADFEEEVSKLRGRLDKIRVQGLTPPELTFRLAQRKVSKGDYAFDVDTDEQTALPTGEQTALPTGEQAALPTSSNVVNPKNLLEGK